MIRAPHIDRGREFFSGTVSEIQVALRADLARPLLLRTLAMFRLCLIPVMKYLSPIRPRLHSCGGRSIRRERAALVVMAQNRVHHIVSQAAAVYPVSRPV